MLEYLPELATLRRFADRMYWLFIWPGGFPPGELPPDAWIGDYIQAVPELVTVIEQLDEEKFPS